MEPASLGTSWITESQINLDWKRSPRVQPLPNLHLVTQGRAQWKLTGRMSRVSNYLRTLYHCLNIKYLLVFLCIYFILVECALKLFTCVEILSVPRSIKAFPSCCSFNHSQREGRILPEHQKLSRAGGDDPSYPVFLPRIWLPNSSLSSFCSHGQWPRFGPQLGFLLCSMVQTSSPAVWGGVWCLHWAGVSLPRHPGRAGLCPRLSWLLADPWADIWDLCPAENGTEPGWGIALACRAARGSVGGTEITRGDFWGSLGGWIREPVLPEASQTFPSIIPIKSGEPFSLLHLEPAPCCRNSTCKHTWSIPCSSISCFPVEHSSPQHESDETLISIPELIVEGKVPRTCTLLNCRFQFGVIFVLLAPLYCPAGCSSFSSLPFSLPTAWSSPNHGKLEANSLNLLRGTCPRKQRIIFPDC